MTYTYDAWIIQERKEKLYVDDTHIALKWSLNKAKLFANKAEANHLASLLQMKTDEYYEVLPVNVTLL